MDSGSDLGINTTSPTGLSLAPPPPPPPGAESRAVVLFFLVVVVPAANSSYFSPLREREDVQYVAEPNRDLSVLT